MEDSNLVLPDFRALLEAAPDGIAAVDERGRILVVNEQMWILFGYETNELIGKSVEVLVPQRLREIHHGHRERYRASPTRRSMGVGLDLVGRRKDGTEVPVEISLSPLIAGRRTFTVAIARDISERLRLQDQERALREAIAAGRDWPVLASVLLEAAPVGCLVVNDQAEILMANAQTEKLFGFSRRELIGEKVDILVPPRLRDTHIAGREAYLCQPTVRQTINGVNLLAQRKDGWEFPVEVSLSPLETDHGFFVVTLVRDLTEQNQLQAEQEALRTFFDTEQERHRIGMDLHDGVMQDIYAAMLGLGMAYEDIDTEPGQAKQSVSHAIDQLHYVIRDIRSYIFDLRPRRFAGDIRVALVDLAQEFQENTQIKTEVRIAPESPEIEHQIGLAFYVIAHEALSNTRKNAQASNVFITLMTDFDGVHLEIRDDGRGFDPSTELSEKHRGLRNMASRASTIGADLRIDSAPGQGTAVRVHVRRDLT
jgi:PAS domain S-box-containing protein